MKPSERIMEIYLENIKKHISEGVCPIPTQFSSISNKVYSDSIVQYLDEKTSQ